jgi:ABC-type lipoprotein export system ATPase subunit
VIVLRDVSKVYRSAKGEVRALDGVSLEVAAGQFIAVRGHSGCGKSTLLALVGGLALPTGGRVEVDGQAVSEMTASQRAAFRAQDVGFVFQMFHLLPYLSVLDNVLLAAGNGAPDAAQAEALSLLEKFGLSDRLTHKPSELSAGERQRVAMARALLNRPRLLLADEPTGNLDPKNAAGVLDLLAAFHQAGGTVLLVTHDDKAAAAAQRTIELDHGRIVEPAAAAPSG